MTISVVIERLTPAFLRNLSVSLCRLSCFQSSSPPPVSSPDLNNNSGLLVLIAIYILTNLLVTAPAANAVDQRAGSIIPNGGKTLSMNPSSAKYVTNI